MSGIKSYSSVCSAHMSLLLQKKKENHFDFDCLTFIVYQNICYIILK